MRSRPLSIIGVIGGITLDPSAGVVELADTPDLGSGAARFGGSSPPSRISEFKRTVAIGSSVSPLRRSKALHASLAFTITPVVAILFTSLTGCWGDKMPSPSAVTNSCSPTAEEFATNARQGYDYFKRHNAADWRVSLETIREVRARAQHTPSDSSLPLIWEEGDRFPSVRRSDGSVFRLTPILNRHQVSAILRVATNNSAKVIVVIAQTPATSRQILLIIDTRTGATSEINVDAYDALWMDNSSLLFSARVNYEPRAVFSLRLGEAPREIASTKEPGEALLLRSSGREGYGFIEHSHPEWSFFEVANSSNPSHTKIITSKGTPGSACSILENSIFCSSFSKHPNGSISRTALGGESRPHTVYVESSGGAISHLSPCSEGLAIFTSHGSYSTQSVISSEGALVRAPLHGGETTTLVPAPSYIGGTGSRVTRRSFLRPNETMSVECMPNVSPAQRSRFCESCVERSLSTISADGVSIPISLVTPSNPRGLLIKVYGSYGVSSRAEFSPEVISLTHQGIAVALAHVRGGGELGPSWHSQAKSANKARSVEDLSASISELSRMLNLPPQRVILYGRSAGAWLAAKTATLHPEKISALILEAPLLDLEKVVPNKTLPLYERERHEWGVSPKVLRAFSPTLPLHKMSIDLLAQIPLRDQLAPPYDTLRWLRDFECHQSPHFRTIVSLLPEADHSGPTSRLAVDEWSAAQEVFIKNVIERE